VLSDLKELVDKQIDILANHFDEIEKQVEEFKSDNIGTVVSKAKSFINS
jgi:hypothetical protein